MFKLWGKFASKKKWQGGSRKGCDNDTVASSVHEDVSIRRKRDLSNQMLSISNDGFRRGSTLLNEGKFDEAREIFEDALAARLVLYGPDSEKVLKAHYKLMKIADIQGNVTKAAHHRLKILQLTSRAYQSCRDPVDWSILSE
eukprot:CAMPEP_0171366378 /NCGR_PEP_ID=MMETSP0879-20121228/5352_1 /TAXON_ID=67004 /ORGANISM="Thalassiosira weissflogii, Strain CCMP1336" /LENGTH=141 /DNA_ID=CAMNT_0011874181 /DNA_START=199 /DNA_END=624 /DNA_ORIENTATION=-